MNCICAKCGKKFDEYDLVKQPLTYTGTVMIEGWVSPCCHEDWYGEGL